MEFNPIDFSHFYDYDDFEEMRSVIFDIKDGKKESESLHIHASKQPNSDRQTLYDVHIAVLKRDKDGKPEILLGTKRDITDRVFERLRAQEQVMQYQTVFNSSLVDMVFYDEDGYLTDINDHSCQTFNVTDKQRLIESHMHIDDMTGFNGMDYQHMDTLHCTTIMDMKQLDDEGLKSDAIQVTGKMYYELIVHPVHDESGDLLGIFMAGRNITEMVESVHRQRETMIQLQRASNSVKAYTDNINMALQMAECRIVNYFPDTHILQLTNDMNLPQTELSQVQCIGFVDSKDYRKASRLFRRMDHRHGSIDNERIRTIMKPSTAHHHPMVLEFNVVPMYDQQGDVSHYFGLSRNITELVMTEEKLLAETRKAHETETLKTSFLLNMSYEIRTPLSTVLGFAELFETEHDPADEPVFVEEIKKNSNSLLELVNDILYISRIDANMVEVKQEPTDFALMFDSSCNTGWSSNIKPGVKTIVENPYNHLVVSIDQTLLSKVIESLVFNAMHFTQEGFVRAKYDYRGGELNITVEDTGVGIDAQTLPHIFERFTRNQNQEQCGTGLVLPIIKELAELMGGKVDAMSEIGKGTTIWVTIPCELLSLDKKKDSLV